MMAVGLPGESLIHPSGQRAAISYRGNYWFRREGHPMKAARVRC